MGSSGSFGRLTHTWARLVAVIVMLSSCILVYGLMLSNTPPSYAGPDDGDSVAGVEFEKYWDDEGYEDKRPESVTFHLYKEGEEQTELASVVLTESANAVAGEDDHWHGVFAGFPTTDDEGHRIPYVITEDVPESYIASYDYGYDGYEVTFTDDSAVDVLSSVCLSLLMPTDADARWTGNALSAFVTTPQVDNGMSSVAGTYSIREGTEFISPYAGPASNDLTTQSYFLPSYDIRYLTQCRGNDYPQVMDDYPQGYSAAWEYAANVGRHTPRLRLVIHGGSGGGRMGAPKGNHLGISDISPVRGDSRTYEITGTINLRDYPVTKVWQDTEKTRASRPGQTTMDLFRDGQGDAVSTLVMTPSDAIDENTWFSRFTDVPRYDEQYREIEYTLVERPLDGYIATYDSAYYNAIDVTFSAGTNTGFLSCLSLMRTEDNYYFVNTRRLSANWGSASYVDDTGTAHPYSVAQGLTHTFQGREFYIVGTSQPPSEQFSDDWGFSIQSVRRVHVDLDSLPVVPYTQGDYVYLQQVLSQSHTEKLVEVKEGEFVQPDKTSSVTNIVYHYAWNPYQSFAGADVVTGIPSPSSVSVEKYWDDEGYEDRRPDSVTLRLATEDAPDVVLSTITLSAADAVEGEPDHWHGVFEGFPARNQDGEAIPYVVTEDVPDGYLASYDYGYDGYHLEFADDAGIAYPTGANVLLIDKDGTVHEVSFYKFMDGIVQDGGHGYPLGGVSYDIDWESGNVPYENDIRRTTYAGYYGTSYWGSVLPTDIKHYIDFIGDEYPESMKSYPGGYNVILRYKANLGRNTPEMIITIHSESWGRSSSPQSTGIAFKKVTPIRNPDKPLEVTNTIDCKKVSIRKVWDDEGLEEHRPESVTVDLYCDDETEPCATRTFDSASATGTHEWTLEFDGLPKYRADGHEHEYTPRERPVPGYSVTYDSEYLDGIDVTFTEGTSLAANGVYGVSPDTDEWYWFSRHTPWSDLGPYTDSNGVARIYSKLSGLTYSFPTKSFAMHLTFTTWQAPGSIGIESVRRVHIEPTMDHGTASWADYAKNEVRTAETGLVTPVSLTVLHEGDEAYLQYSNSAYVKYEWDDSKTFPGADIIINHSLYHPVTVTKIWDDVYNDGHRPETCTLDLYDETGTVIDTVTLDESCYDAALSQGCTAWRGNFSKPAVHDDGTPFAYVIKERPVPGYQTLYDSDDERAVLTELTFSPDTDLIYDSQYYVQCDTRDCAGEGSSPNDSSKFAYTQGASYNVARRNYDDGTITVTTMGSRTLIYMGNASKLTLLSVKRSPGRYDPNDDTYGFASQTVAWATAGAPEKGGNAYDCLYVDSVPYSWQQTTGDAKGKYLLYEQTEPFPYDNVIRNRPYKTAAFQKVMQGANGIVPLDDTEFSVIQLDEAGREVEVTSGVTPAGGVWTTTALGRGTYLLREKRAKPGFAYAEDIPFWIDGTGHLIKQSDDGYAVGSNSWQAYNNDASFMRMFDIITSVSFKKEYESGESPSAPPPVFRILDMDGTVIEEIQAPYWQYNGRLEAGKSYTLQEISAPAGYSIAKPVTFTVNRDGTPQTVIVTNAKTRAEISKTDVTTGHELPGAQLRLTDSAGAVIDEWTSTEAPHLIDEGILVTGETYTLHEDAAPDGYSYAEDVSFVAGQAGSPDKVEIRDSPTKVSISKVAITGGEEIAGAELTVTDMVGNTMDEWTSTNEPHLIVGKLIADQTYVLHENAAPAGYEVASDIEFVVHHDGTTTKVEMVDKAIPADDIERSTEQDSNTTPDITQHPSSPQLPEGTHGPAGTEHVTNDNHAESTPLAALVQTGDRLIPAGVGVFVAAAGLGTITWVRRGKRG